MEAAGESAVVGVGERGGDPLDPEVGQRQQLLGHDEAHGIALAQEARPLRRESPVERARRKAEAARGLLQRRLAEAEGRSKRVAKPGRYGLPVETEAAGQRFTAGEVDRDCRPFAAPLDALLVKGRIDRIDDSPAGPWLLDYKTGDAKSLKDKLAAPLEDTQLAT